MLSIQHSIALVLAVFTFGFGFAYAESRAELDRSARTVLNQLVASNANAKKLNEKAIATLVFPVVTKAGLIVGGQYGDGVWLDFENAASNENKLLIRSAD